MTKEKKKSDEKKTDNSKNKTPGKKLILYELVQSYPIENWVIRGALSKAGLLDEYRYQRDNWEKEEFKPSITVDEFAKIMKEFLGE